MTQTPDWQVAVIAGEPEMVLNTAMVRALVKTSPLGPDVARQRLLAAGYPPHLLDEPKE